MIYDTYINKAFDLVIEQDEDTGIWYLNPNWFNLLYTNELEIEKISEDYIGQFEIEEALKLEVQRRNIKNNSKKQVIIDWLYDIITAKVEPQLMQEETEYVAQMIEYLRFRDAEAQKKAEQKEKLPNTLNNMDFTKKTALSR